MTRWPALCSTSDQSRVEALALHDGNRVWKQIGVDITGRADPGHAALPHRPVSSRHASSANPECTRSSPKRRSRANHARA